MKFTANASSFSSALALVMRSINPRLSITAGRGVFIEASGGYVTLTGTDIQTAARVRVAATVRHPGRLLLGAHMLAEALRKPSGLEVSFAVEGKGMVAIAVGRSRYEIPQMDVDDFPPVGGAPDDPILYVPGEYLHLAADHVAFAVATPDMGRPALLGMALRFKPTHMQVIAGDSAVFAELQVPYEGGRQPEPGTEISLLPPSVANIQRFFEPLDSVGVSVHKGWASFRAGDREYHAKTLAELFPSAVDDVFNRARQQLCSWIEVERKPLIEALMRMDVVASGEDIHPVRFAVCHAKELHLYSATRNGRARDLVDVEGDGPDFTCGINAKQMLALLDKVPGDKVRIDLPGHPGQPLIITPAAVPEGSPPYTLLLAPLHPASPTAASTMAGPQ